MLERKLKRLVEKPGLENQEDIAQPIQAGYPNSRKNQSPLRSSANLLD